MRDKHTDIANSIRSIVGIDNITETPGITIDGLSPTLLARPSSAEEVRACLEVCSQFEAAVIPAGQMRWLDCGNPVRRADVVLSLERMRRVIDYSPPDLTATVEAGLSLSEMTEVTMKHRQWLPLDPPGFKSATVGAVAACNSSGALRLGFGTPRDYVIGLKLAHADGTRSKSGGGVVKNVAGYDLNKLYVGSYGTLAVITELTFKLRPAPERNSTLMITARNRGPLFTLAKKLLASELQPVSVVLTRSISTQDFRLPEDALFIRFIDNEASVEHQLRTVRESAGDGYEISELSEPEAQAVWAEVADFNQGAIRVRASVPLSAVAAEFEKAIILLLECVACVDIGVGIIRLAFDADEDADKKDADKKDADKKDAAGQIERLRAGCEASGGTLVIEKASTGTRREADAWGDVGSTARLMRSLKEKFDPQSLLNPGKFVAGI